MVDAYVTVGQGNSKTGPMHTISTTQASCPPTCRLMGNGCYAEYGPQGIHTRRLNAATPRGISPEDIAREEARLIAQLPPDKPIRLHVVGDTTTNQAARLLARAVKWYSHVCYTYTHAWCTVSRKAWGCIQVLASCESTDEVRQAEARGYKAALVVDRFQSNKAYWVDGIKVIPCPQQTGRATNCRECKLCIHGRFDGTIGFEAHGSGARRVRDLVSIQTQGVSKVTLGRS